ncbi:MAG TPA: serine/threonine-protein kinase, partial [Planctomycetota bacterium]|nr:serine/threonine-protein kinase [Planctomycetota bacterium]
MMLGDHEVVRLLGRGAMGSVHEVRHVATGARYAAKVMTAGTDARALERFRREAELLARCDSHPGIVHVHSFGTLEGGAPYMILDLVEGENLDALRQREGTLEPRRAATIIRDVASALGFMHERGIVHRDVKPANVLLDHQGRARLTDFGIASAVDLERLTRTGTFVGTFAYAAPEQLMTGDADEAADVFSLGCVLFELVAGRLPIDAETPTDHMRAVERGDLPARARALGIPRGLASVIARALAK